MKKQEEVKLPNIPKPKQEQGPPSLYNFYQKIIVKNNPE